MTEDEFQRLKGTYYMQLREKMKEVDDLKQKIATLEAIDKEISELSKPPKKLNPK